MIVYGPSVSPYVRKVMVFAAEKGIELQKEMGVGPNPDPEFLAASPFRKIPAFRDGDFTISDSSAIVAYLDKIKAEPRLIPEEARAHARAIWFDEFADTLLCAAGIPIFFNRCLAKRFGREPDMAAADKAEREALPPVLDYVESVIPDSGFLVEDRLTLADIAVAGPFANLIHAGIEPDPKARPRTARYLEAMLSRPSFAPLIEAEKAFLAS
jgi:glutathione S-transferase